MAKKIALLAAALFWLCGTHVLWGATYSSSSKKKRKSSVRTTASRKKTHSSKILKASAHRRRRRYNPWRLTSYGDSAAGDNPAGEDPIIREAAVAALGKWNGAVAVVDPNNGRILTLVNQKLATESAFTPCSTIKPITALAALKEGVITPDTILRAEYRLRAYGSRNINLTTALAHSSNNYFSQVGRMLGFDRLTEYAREMGLGEKTAEDIPGESAGHFPLEPPKEGGVGMVAYDGLTFDVTTLQMAAMVSAIANGGTLYELQYPRTPEEVADFQPKVRRQLNDLAPYFADVKAGMAAAVLYGTARFAYDPQNDIYGKTGTCTEDGARLGWFVSYSGQQEPKYAVVVLLRGGRSMMGPHAAEIGGKLYHDLNVKNQRAEMPLPAITLIGPRTRW
ncbi:MAG TPA: penicillin-binding transpeptidase domain-containing protein [Terriglobia bacterium]|nr:penicillin-binding transpeptidase domain-containing protein [Terriglobia bacterium]